ncbi:MAG TPA: hypothetical protein P5326_00110 [Candidatus Contendobacter sp.]|nr:hypothetical protein [Candidatus Contendobacter sp.]HRZ22422.1 hypothetical protein [Candidatus Contendobacter sp.]
MQWRKWLEKWDMTSLKISAPFLEMEWKPQTADKEAAWELYVELLTRVSTQGLPPDEGDEKAALDSIYELFDLTREIIKRHGRDCLEFTKVAVVVLNQVVRPFSAKWHRKSLEGSLSSAERPAFRADLAALQAKLRNYTKMLADMAGVEDLTALEDR